MIKMKRIAILNPEDLSDKIVIFQDLKNRNKFTYRTFGNGHGMDKTEILPKLEAEALCKLCGVEY